MDYRLQRPCWFLDFLSYESSTQLVFSFCPGIGKGIARTRMSRSESYRHRVPDFVFPCCAGYPRRAVTGRAIQASERQMVWVSRALVWAIGIVGYLIALLEPPTVFGIVVFTTSVLGSAFLPSHVCAVWWRKANTPGAIASMVSGAIIAFVWELAALAESRGLHPMLAGIVSSTTAMIVVSLATQAIAPVPDHIVAKTEAAARLGSSSSTGNSLA